MDQYFLKYFLLGMNSSNLPVHRGMRQKRYQSIQKMLDLIDIAKRIGPKFPAHVLMCDQSDPQWDDDMTYLHVDYSLYKSYVLGVSMIMVKIHAGFMLYNYNFFFRNKNAAALTKFMLFGTFVNTNFMIARYRKQVLRANLFDEYVQLRADEIVKEKTELMKQEDVIKYIWFEEDLKETLNRVHRQAWNNQPKDFADSELILQDFIRRYTDDTLLEPLDEENSRLDF